MSLWHPRYRFSCLFFFLGLILWLPLNLHTSRSEPNSGQVCHEACMGRTQARFSRSDCGRYKMKYIHRIFVYLYTILYMSIYKETNGGFILLYFLSFACSFVANSLRNSHSFRLSSLTRCLHIFVSSYGRPDTITDYTAVPTIRTLTILFYDKLNSQRMILSRTFWRGEYTEGCKWPLLTSSVSTLLHYKKKLYAGKMIAHKMFGCHWILHKRTKTDLNEAHTY
jgi:hypothetical protein